MQLTIDDSGAIHNAREFGGIKTSGSVEFRILLAAPWASGKSAARSRRESIERPRRLA